MGAKVALRVTARRRDVRATVAEGLNGGAQDAAADADLVEQVAPRPLMLISAGRGSEAATNRVFTDRAGAAAEHWNLPDASHAAAIGTDTKGYEGRVIPFLDRAPAVS
jgi:hypothetical protein